MKVAASSVVVLVWPLCVASTSLSEAPPRHTILQLQRKSSNKPTLFGGPKQEGAELHLHGFCKRPDKKPACDEQPCCCWSTWAAPVHPDYPDKGETQTKQLCLNPPDGFVYAPDPGLSYDDGYMETLKQQSLPVYDGRRLCCLRRAHGVQVDSQQDLSNAVKTTTTTTTTADPFMAVAAGPAAAAGLAAASDIGITTPAAFTTETLTTAMPLNAGDEFETAQMEEAARAHLQAANDLKVAVTSLSNSASAINEVNIKLQNDPDLIRSRKHVAEMRAAIDAWSKKRWENLGKLKAGDASAFASPDSTPVSS